MIYCFNSYWFLCFNEIHCIQLILTFLLNGCELAQSLEYWVHVLFHWLLNVENNETVELQDVAFKDDVNIITGFSKFSKCQQDWRV